MLERIRRFWRCRVQRIHDEYMAVSWDNEWAICYHCGVEVELRPTEGGDRK